MIDSIGVHNRFNAEEVAASRAARFEKLDADGSGALSNDEIETLLNKIDERSGISLDLESFAAALDKDGNGEVNLDEFSHLRKVMGQVHPYQRPWGPPHGAPRPLGERLFAKVDGDESGDISESELGGLLDRINERSGKTLNTEEVMAKLDRDADGALSKAEVQGLGRVIGPPVRPVSIHPMRAVETYAEADKASEGDYVPPTIEVPL